MPFHREVNTDAMRSMADLELTTEELRGRKFDAETVEERPDAPDLDLLVGDALQDRLVKRSKPDGKRAQNSPPQTISHNVGFENCPL